MRRRAAPLDAIVQVADTLGPAAAPTSGDARCDWCPYLRPRRHRPGHILRRATTPDRHRDRDGTHEWKGTTMSTFTSPQPHPRASPTPTTRAPPHHRSTALRADRRDQPGDKDAIGATVHDVDPGPPPRMRCCSQSPRRIVEEPCRADRPRDPHPGVAKPGQSAPWTLTDATGDPAAVKRATDFLDAYKSGGLAAPEPAVDAATAAALKLLKDQDSPDQAAPAPTGGTGSRPDRAPTNQHDVEESTGGDSRPDRLRPRRSRHHAARRRRLPRHPRRRRLDRAMPRPRRPQPVAVHRRRCRRAAPPCTATPLRHPRHPRRPRPAARRHVHRLPADRPGTVTHQPRPRLAPPQPPPHRPKPHRREKTHHWDYHDRHGAIVARVVRYNLVDVDTGEIAARRSRSTPGPTGADSPTSAAWICRCTACPPSLRPPCRTARLRRRG